MNHAVEHAEQWNADNDVLARIGAHLYEIDTQLPVVLPREMADAAVAAWHRDGTKGDDSLQETDAERTVRQRAGTLALIGAAIERLGRSHTIDTVVVDLDAWFIGLALEAADEHGHIVGPPVDRPGATPRFITVDLDIRAAPEQSLGILIEALTESGTIQNRSEDDGGEFVSFALGEPCGEPGIQRWDRGRERTEPTRDHARCRCRCDRRVTRSRDNRHPLPVPRSERPRQPHHDPLMGGAEI